MESIGLDISSTELRRGNKLLVLARIGIQWILSWHKIGCLVHIWTPKCIGGPFGWKAWDPIFVSDNQQPAFNTFQTRHFRKKIQTLRISGIPPSHTWMHTCPAENFKGRIVDSNKQPNNILLIIRLVVACFEKISNFLLKWWSRNFNFQPSWFLSPTNPRH